MSSKASNMIQMVDVVTGALGYATNDHFKKKDASKAKTILMKYILAKAEEDGYITIHGDTIIRKRSDIFNVWPFKPRGAVEFDASKSSVTINR
jgi:hypothetical protein